MTQLGKLTTEKETVYSYSNYVGKKQVASWPETMQGGFKALFVVSHKETPYRPSNKQQMQCLMTRHLETEQHEPRINAYANAAEMKDTNMEKEMKRFKLICRLLGGRGETRRGCYQFTALPRIPCYQSL